MLFLILTELALKKSTKRTHLFECCFRYDFSEIFGVIEKQKELIFSNVVFAMILVKYLV